MSVALKNSPKCTKVYRDFQPAKLMEFFETDGGRNKDSEGCVA